MTVPSCTNDKGLLHSVCGYEGSESVAVQKYSHPHRQTVRIQMQHFQPSGLNSTHDLSCEYFVELKNC